MQRRPLVNLSGVRSELPTGDTLYGAGAYISDTAPLVPWEGMHWIKSDTGIEYVYYLNGGNPAWVYFGKAGIPGADGLTPSYDPITECVLFADFLDGLTTTTGTGTSFLATPVYPVAHVSSGSSASQAQDTGATGSGVCRLTTGTSTGFPQVFLCKPDILLTAGKTVFQTRVRRTTAVPTIAQDYSTFYGYRDVITGASASSAYVQSSSAAAGGSGWLLSVNGIETAIDGIATPAVGVFFTVKMVLDPAAGTIEVWIDGVLALTHIPPVFPNTGVAPTVRTNKLAGTTSILVDVDYLYHKQTLDRPGVVDAAAPLLRQVVRTESSLPVSTTSGTLPSDNTVPQITEGDAYAELDTTIVPTRADSQLEVSIHIPLVNHATAGANVRFGVFRDSDPDAVYAWLYSPYGSGSPGIATFVVPAGSIDATTFSVRWATSSGTAYINRTAGSAALLGGAMKASMTIRELAG